MDAILGKPTKGIPSWLINPMEHTVIDRLAGKPLGTYRQAPVPTYLAMQKAIGTGMVDQWIPENPLSMGAEGYSADTHRTATMGVEEIICDGIRIDSPEAVIEHLEKFVFPYLENATVDADAHVRSLITAEAAVQTVLAPEILKVPYGVVEFPYLPYYTYGYTNFFMAYALYPEVMERLFARQADRAVRINRAVARAYVEGGLPPLCRLDHDIADSRGTLVDVTSLDRIWFPHFARAIEPLLKANVRLIWHCDGNLMAMVPRLLAVGLGGFQGFQYEDGMDYEKICALKTRDGAPLLIIAGVSVTRTLPFGTPADVRKEMQWLVEHGPATGLFLGGSSSIAPGVPWDNLVALVEGFRYYREHGR
ncbi:MAG: hypothetical protein PCFJNLEI_00105 [Verrucomicrobiae bacterium]|nr:hypothetical protein [Verrucomicrobiae bacterium]